MPYFYFVFIMQNLMFCVSQSSSLYCSLTLEFFLRPPTHLQIAKISPHSKYDNYWTLSMPYVNYLF